MARNWKKFRLDELCYLWSTYKSPSQEDPLNHRTTSHRQLELTKEEIEELVDHLFGILCRAKEEIDGTSFGR